jgi:tetratricopeptide (TPR) repeat protein
MKRQLLLGVLSFAAATYTLSAASPTADAEFRKAMAALQLNDYGTGLQQLELAIIEDPDNLRYASEYRQAIIRHKEFDRSIEFFEKLLADHPASANLHLNYGFAYVDKIPIAGSITQVILANTALGEFSKAVDLQSSWLAYYTRGASYLFWPKIFNKAPSGVADLEKALAIQKNGPRKPYYVRAYVALGDGYCKMEETDKARAAWQEGLRQFPDSMQLKDRLSLHGDELVKLIENNFDPNKRVDTDLREIWSDGQRHGFAPR